MNYLFLANRVNRYQIKIKKGWYRAYYALLVCVSSFLFIIKGGNKNEII